MGTVVEHYFITTVEVAACMAGGGGNGKHPCRAFPKKKHVLYDITVYTVRGVA